MADIKVSDLPGASYIYDQDLLLLSQDAGDDLESRKGTVGQLKNHLIGIWLTGTLTAGQTSLTLQDAAITTGSSFDFYTDTFGVNPSGVSVSTGSITMTFPEQASDVSVKVRVF